MKKTIKKKEVAFFYEVESFDIENIQDQDAFYEELQKSLMSLDDRDILRFYHLQGRSFLYSNNESLKLHGMTLKPCDKPLQAFILEDVFTTIDFKDDYLHFNENFVRIFSVKSLPEEMGPNGLTNLGDYVLSFQKIETIKATEKLKFKRRIHFSNLFTGIKNIESTEAYKESEILLEDITKGKDELFNVEIFFILKTESKEELTLKTKELLKKAKLKGIQLRLETLALTYFFKNLMVEILPRFKRSHSTPASFLKWLVPMEGEKLMNEGIVFHSRKNRELKFNLFHKSAINFNLLFTGESGQGKSMTANKVVFEEVKKGTSAVILDYKGSFSKNVRYLGGKEIKGRFNPLVHNDPLFLKEFILSFIEEGLSSKDQGKLLKSLREEVNQHRSFEGLIGALKKDFPDLPYYFEEGWEYFTNEETNLNNLSYLDFGNFPEKLKAPLILYLFESFKKLQGRKIFVFDECWDLLKNHADFVSENFRTLRKFNGSAIAIGQNLEDVLGTRLGRVIAQNTFFKLYFKQKFAPNEFVSPWMLSKIESLRSQKGEYSEALLSFEGMNKILRYKSSPLEFDLFMTDENEKHYFEDYMEVAGRFLPFQKAMENFTKIRQGVAL